MDSRGQLFVFCICLCVGFVGGILYEGFGFIRVLFSCPRGKNKILGGALDVAFCIAFALVAVAAAYLFGFPAFRVYMWAGYALGGIIYLKTLHKIIAFLENVCYNKITEWTKKAKKREKTLKKRGKRV